MKKFFEDPGFPYVVIVILYLLLIPAAVWSEPLERLKYDKDTEAFHIPRAQMYELDATLKTLELTIERQAEIIRLKDKQLKECTPK